MTEAGRDLYLREGLAYVPKLLELVDKDRLSPTYGCFDRSYWHYRTIDFPSGMYQEAVLPLALLFVLKSPGNPYYQEERLLEIVIAGIDFARRSSHADGSCDDYFPYERAAGAAAFSLYACSEAYRLLKLDSPVFRGFFRQRADYLAGQREAGTLSNHKALIILALYNVYEITSRHAYKDAAEKRLEELLSLQSGEGWFPEYEGCDPGYLTFTIDFLAKYYQKSGNAKVLPALKKAVRFASYFMHPDGSYGGEYGSRNTFHFLPHGFELMGAEEGCALPAARLFLESLRNGKRSYLDDDRIFIHYTYNFLQAYLDYSPASRNGRLREEEDFFAYFEEAGLAVRGTRENYAVVSVKKGGVAKIFKKGALVLSDTGLVAKTTDGRRLITQVTGPFRSEINSGQITVEGSFYRHRDRVFQPWLFVLFRLFLILIGRFLPANAVRRFLQKKTILKKKEAVPVQFRKEIDLEEMKTVKYTVYLEGKGCRLKDLWVATDAAFIYVATSQPFQPGNLKSWMDLSSILPGLRKHKTAKFVLPIK